MPERDIFFLCYIDRNLNGEAFTALEKVGGSSGDRFVIRYMGRDQLEDLEEGNFVQVSEGNLLEKANSHKKAKAEFYKNNVYRTSLLARKNSIASDAEIYRVSKVFSYHINVGHGNCSVLVIDDCVTKKIWMVDCSDFDFINNNSYWPNIESCINHICLKFGLDNFKIDKFFLTHTHFDHFSGMKKLIDMQYLNGAEVWINLHYSWASPRYNEILSMLKTIGATFVEPIEKNSIGNINIWHPTLRTVRSKTRKYAEDDVKEIKNVNNSSVVYQFVFDEKSIVFPGDIEAQGWDSVTKCFPNLNETSYFCISHHGSLNGHTRNYCPKGINISSVAECNKVFKKAILMGRDKAYNGIYSSKVLSDFSGLLVKSEECPEQNVCKFIEIDFSKDTVKHF